MNKSSNFDIFGADGKKIPAEPSLLKAIEERQQMVLDTLPQYVKATTFVALTGFLATVVYQLILGSFPLKELGLVIIQNPTAGSIIAFILSLFSILTMWLYVIWTLSFIPYIAYQAQQTARKYKIGVGSRSFRWLQLYAATFLPAITFALAWNSFPSSSNVDFYITTLKDGVFIVIGAALVFSTLFFSVRVIPSKLLVLHVAIISILLYISLFLSYGFGYGIASFATLFGILIYLTFNFQELDEIGRRITIYDIDTNIAEELNNSAKYFQTVKVKEDEIKVKELELEYKEKQNAQKQKLQKVQSQETVIEQLKQIEETRIKFSNQVNETQLKVFNKKSVLLNDMYEILSKELDKRMDEEIPRRIKELQDNAKDYTPKQLQENMSLIFKEMESSLNGIPEGLANLRTEMDEVIKQITIQTKAQLGEGENNTSNTTTSNRDKSTPTDEV